MPPMSSIWIPGRGTDTSLDHLTVRNPARRHARERCGEADPRGPDPKGAGGYGCPERPPLSSHHAERRDSRDRTRTLPPLCAAIGCAFPAVVTAHNRVICVAHGRGRRRHPAAKGAVLLWPARGLGVRRELGADLDRGACWLAGAADPGRVLEPEEKGGTPATSPLAAGVLVR